MGDETPQKVRWADLKRYAQGDTEGMSAEYIEAIEDELHKMAEALAGIEVPGLKSAVATFTEAMAGSDRESFIPLLGGYSTALRQAAEAIAKEQERTVKLAKVERAKYTGWASEGWPLIEDALKAGIVRFRAGVLDDTDLISAEFEPGMERPTVELVLDYLAPDVYMHLNPEAKTLHNLEGAGTEAMADAIRAAYAVCDPGDIDAALRPLKAIEPFKPAGFPLDKTLIDRSELGKQLFPKILDAVLEGDTTTAEAITHDGTKYSVSANTQALKQLKESGGIASPAWLRAVWGVVALIAKSPDIKKYELNGRIAVKADAIARELSRTTAGATTTKTKRAGDTRRRDVDNALWLLTSMQYAERDEYGELGDVMYVLPGNRRRTITDNQGNVIHDVWIFDRDTLNYAEAIEGKKQLDEHPLLTMDGPATNFQAAARNELQANVVSIMRAHFYPSVGNRKKGITPASTMTKTLDARELVDTIEGNPVTNYRTRQKKEKELAEVINAICDEEADRDKPLYINAEAIKGKSGRLESIRLRARSSEPYKKPKRLRVTTKKSGANYKYDVS